MSNALRPVRVGVLGCGNISDQYFENATNLNVIDMVAVADLKRDVAAAQAAKYGVKSVLMPDELIASDDVEVVLNLTIPHVHVETMLKTLDAGKHTFCEKPLGVDREEGRKVLEKAEQTGLLVGVAPDTVLGSGIQTARKAIDDGMIGTPTAVTAIMAGGGHETWHPSPEFYYKPGGGPMFDMGPYYLTALLQMLGAITRVSGFANIAITPRTITSEPLNGTKVDVETPDHYVAILQFANGVTGTIVQSFAMPGSPHDAAHPIVITGTEGVLKVPDPNSFDGDVHLSERGSGEWQTLSPVTPKGYGRSVGLADLCAAIQQDRKPRCNIDQGFVVLDAMQGFRDSNGNAVEITTPYDRPPLMPSEFGVFA
ncbi:MAG: Gfo/Idh/MocA family oxidoreductase [Planctomycetota bacterium]